MIYDDLYIYIYNQNTIMVLFKMLTIESVITLIWYTHTDPTVFVFQHNRLSNRLYEMTWYDMPNNYKQLIVIMYQRTQKNLSLSSALFASDTASRKLTTKVIKQVYTILNLLLNLNWFDWRIRWRPHTYRCNEFKKLGTYTLSLNRILHSLKNKTCNCIFPM